MLGFLLVISVVALLHGGNPMTLIWGPGSPLTMAGSLLVAAIPVYALWALPTVGWLLLCSAWSRSKPFLWAIMIPVFAGIFVSWFDLMQAFNLESVWFWQNVVARILFSVVPGSWIGCRPSTTWQLRRPRRRVSQLFSLETTYSTPADAAVVDRRGRRRGDDLRCDPPAPLARAPTEPGHATAPVRWAACRQQPRHRPTPDLLRTTATGPIHMNIKLRPAPSS